MPVFSLVPILALPSHVLAAPPPPIIDGEDASSSDYPMAGAVIVEAEYASSSTWGTLRMFTCSSSLIAPDVVLLAAHCVDPAYYADSNGQDPQRLEFRWSREADVSTFDGYSIPDWPADAVLAWDTSFHDSYSLAGIGWGLGRYYDIGLLFLEQAQEDIPLAYLPTEAEAAQMAEGAPLVLVGWGLREDLSAPYPDDAFGLKQMGDSSIEALASWEFKAAESTSGAVQCSGDSGGPAFMEVDSDSSEPLRQVGVTSHAYDTTGCLAGAANTRVDAYLSWIDQELRSRCESGERVWCDVEGIIPPPTDTPDDTGAEPDEPGGGDGLTDEDTDPVDGHAGGFGQQSSACGCTTGGLPTSWVFWLLASLSPFIRRRRGGLITPQ